MTTIAAMLNGILGAIAEAEGPDFSAGLLVSVHRHRTEEAAFEVLRAIAPWSDRILGIGMGGAEIGNPPSRFTRFFRAAQAAGFPTTVHAGEEGPPAYVREALALGVRRIDHGVAAAADPALRLRPPRPTSPVPEPAYGRIRRRPILGGLINEDETAA